MFQKRNSRSGRYEYLIQVERTQKGNHGGRHAAKIAQVIERATGVAVARHPPVREHYGEWPEEAVDEVFEEAEMILFERPAPGHAPSRTRFEGGPAGQEPMVRQFGPNPSAEWRALVTRPLNVLFEGAEPSAQRFLSVLKPSLRQPVVWRRPGEPLDLRPDHDGALVLQDVAALDPEEQRLLSQWLEDTSRERQIVSTTTAPLFPLVECGQFDRALYYRLNMVLLHA